MYNLTLTKEDFDLIGECVLATINMLRKSWEQMPLEGGRVGIQEQIVRCNGIMRTLAKVEEGEE